MRSIPLLNATLLACAAIPAAAADLGVQFHGFASQGYLTTTNGNNYLGDTAREAHTHLFSGDGGTANFTELGFNATAQPYDRVTLGIQIAAQDFGRYYGMKPQIDWAYGRYELPKKFEWLDANLALGRVKYGHALYNDYRDLDMTRTAVFLPQSNYAAMFRDIYLAGNGAQLNLAASAGALGDFELSAFLGTTNLDTNSGLADKFTEPLYAITIPGGPTLTNDVALDTVKVKRIEEVNLTWNTPAEGLKLKGSLFLAQNITFDGTWTPTNRSTMVGLMQAVGIPALTSLAVGNTYAFNITLPSYYQAVASAEYQTGDWTFAAEYSHDYMSLQSTSTAIDPVLRANALLGTLSREARVELDNGYLSATWQVNPRWSAYGAICATNYGDGEHYDPAMMHRGYNLAVRWDVTKHFLLKAEAERNEGGFLLFSQDNPQGKERWWNLFAVKGTFDF